jgi:gamma-glutamylputrescine oxidase
MAFSECFNLAQDVNTDATWYEATARRGAPSGPLHGVVEADVCVVGAGLAGLTTALELARRGKQVVLLEGRLIGSGASGRNGGFVSNGFAQGIEDVAGLVGQDSARALYDLSRMGTDFVRTEIAGAEPTVKMGDGLLVAVRHDDKGELKSHVELMRRNFGEEVSFLERDETRRKLRTNRYFDSLYLPGAFHIHPLRYCLLLARKASAAGAKIYELSPALSVNQNAGLSVVKTSYGEVRAQHVVHCVSKTGKSVHALSDRAILPVATYVAVTEPLQHSSIATTAAIADTRRAGDYYRLVDQGRILWGGAITTRVSEPRHLAQRMKRGMVSTYPDLGKFGIDYAWSGIMGYALHKMPLIGRDAAGQWFATAFGGHGLNTTAMAGVLVARAIAEGDDAYRRFSPFAPRWAFGQLGRLGVQGSYWLMQIKDKRDESRLFSRH